MFFSGGKICQHRNVYVPDVASSSAAAAAAAAASGLKPWKHTPPTQLSSRLYNAEVPSKNSRILALLRPYRPIDHKSQETNHDFFIDSPSTPSSSSTTPPNPTPPLLSHFSTWNRLIRRHAQAHTHVPTDCPQSIVRNHAQLL